MIGRYDIASKNLLRRSTSGILRDLTGLEMPNGTMWNCRTLARTAGREEGRTEGHADILLSLIEERFGPVDASTLARIETLDSVTAKQIARRILQARSIDELLA